MSRTFSGRRSGRAGLWLRWSWRDLRSRWLQVVAIALVIALGTGSYAGLSSVTVWRRTSTDEAYRQLRMYDLRVRLPDGASVAAGNLARRARAALGDEAIASLDERLIVEVQVDASTGEQAILVPGLLYGVDLAAGPAQVNAFHVVQGRPLEPQDADADTVLLEYNFARHYKLPPAGSITVTGGQALQQLQYAGQALTPEYFLVTTERGGLLAEASFAAVFTSRDTAQRLSGKPGQVNDLVLRLQPGADRATARDALQAALEREGSLAAEVTTREQDPAFRLNDRDIDGDQQIYQIFAVLIFAGAAGAAFNLSARIVDAQRREIGIAMALGLQPWRIAIRPMLVGAQVALLGVVFGLAVGYLIGQSMVPLLKELQPLPAWRTSYRPQLFALVGTLGFLLPLLATAWPVWRAVRVAPIETIRPAYRAGRGGGLAPLVRWLRIPGNTLQQAPLRNLARAPRRSLITGLGIAAALAALVSFVGLIDSFVATTDRGDREILGDSPQRLQVRLSGLLPAADAQVSTLASLPGVAAAEPGLLLDAAIIDSNGESTDLQLELRNLESGIWRPSLIAGAYDRQTPGIYLSELAARDLGVRPGDSVRLRHRRLDPAGNLVTAETQLRLLGVHPHPFRFVAYMDVNQASLFGMAGVANSVDVLPRDGVPQAGLKRDLVRVAGVAWIESVGDIAESIRDLLDEFVVVLRVVEVAMLLIAALIAYNAASINMDERAREHATMFAFGLPVGTVLRLAVVENLILGLLATLAGLAGGWYLLKLIIAIRVADTMPDILIKATLAEGTLAATIALGIGFVALAPLFTWRKLVRMDVAAAIKVVE